jgi:NTP pyrophosphatase (non-canonical NTP hydrolase)
VRRVAILGRGAAGKSVLAARLGRLTGLSAIELDKHFWKTGLNATPPAEWAHTQSELLRREAWIMDGDLGPYDTALGARPAAADTIIVLNFSPARLTSPRAVQRFLARALAASRTAGVVATDHPIIYPTLGLTNEAGEVAGKVKKIFRDRQGVITDADREALALELGDVLWYLAEICTKLGIRLEDVAAGNIAKIADRVSRGMLRGEGDYR